MNLSQSSVRSLENPYFISEKGDEVDKGSNRSTPGTSGDGPRPPREEEYPDDNENKDEKVKKKHKN